MPEQDPTTDPADDDTPEADDVEETEDADEVEDDTPEWTPPTREQWDAAQAKLTRARKQAQQLREAKNKATAPAAADPQAAATAQADVEKWQARAVSTAAKAELLTRGADPDMVDLALGRLKVSSIEFDDDDQPDLEDWLDDIQDRYPKLFKQPDAAPTAAVRPRAGRVETPASRPVRPKMSLGEQIIAASQSATRRGR